MGFNIAFGATFFIVAGFGGTRVFVISKSAKLIGPLADYAVLDLFGALAKDGFNEGSIETFFLLISGSN